MSNITLYAAVDGLRGVLEKVDPETGELPEGFENILGLVKNKAASVAAYCLQQKAAIDSAKEHVKEVTEKIKRQEKQAEWLKMYLLQNMDAAGIREIKGEGGLTVKLHRERDEAIEVFQEELVPLEYRAPPPKPEDMPVSKTAIKAAIKAGVEVPGALLVKRHRLEIKP